MFYVYTLDRTLRVGMKSVGVVVFTESAVFLCRDPVTSCTIALKFEQGHVVILSIKIVGFMVLSLFFADLSFHWRGKQ